MEWFSKFLIKRALAGSLLAPGIPDVWWKYSDWIDKKVLEALLARGIAEPGFDDFVAERDKLVKQYPFSSKQAMSGSPIAARLAPSPDEPLFNVPDAGHELSDARTAEKWLNELAPMYRSVPLARARARMNALQGIQP
jgi:hypothetical protein